MNVNFQSALDFIWQPQNDGHRNDSAPGENFATVYGVTQPVWDRACEEGLVTGDIATADLAECTAIYHSFYWNAAGCQLLPAGIDLMVFNDAVLCGTGHGSRLLQRVVGAKQDGAVGPKTLALVQRMNTKEVIDQIASGDEAYFASLRNAPRFLNGWTRREKDAQALAYRLAAINEPPPA
jgi:lysozyme family protein